MPHTCVFPSAELQRYRDSLYAEIRKLVKADLYADLRVQMQSLLWIERLAADHEDLTGCSCFPDPQKFALYTSEDDIECSAMSLNSTSDRSPKMRGA